MRGATRVGLGSIGGDGFGISGLVIPASSVGDCIGDCIGVLHSGEEVLTRVTDWIVDWSYTSLSLPLYAVLFTYREKLYMQGVHMQIMAITSEGSHQHGYSSKSMIPPSPLLPARSYPTPQ